MTPVDAYADGYRSAQELLDREPAAREQSADVARRRIAFWHGRLDALTQSDQQHDQNGAPT